MIKRHIADLIKRFKKQFPVVVITGPRQSGKTTLIKNIFPSYNYFNLENPETLTRIESDPASFVKEFGQKTVIDEVQRYPQLLSYIQAAVDEQKKMGSFILSGSENLLLSEKVNQSLAGRAAYVELYPLAVEELKDADLSKKNVYSQVFTGFYPALYAQEIDIIDYYNQYIATYVERDLKQISSIANLSLFRKFLALLSGRIGQLINLSSLANDTGVSVSTIENWISILEASYLIFRLQPHYKNFGKRYIKSPKLYFTDTGLVCRLLKISSVKELKTHYLIGGLIENLIIMEIKKYLANYQSSSDLYFFRDSNNNEVDLIIDQGLQQIPIEIKAGGTFSKNYLKGILYWQKLAKKSKQAKAPTGYIIYTGNQAHKANNYSLLEWNSINPLLKQISK
jgi:uncharacterized protein